MRFLWSPVVIFNIICVQAQESYFLSNKSEVIYQRAVNYIDDQKYDAAIPLLRTYIKSTTSKVDLKEADFLLARCLLYTNAAEGELAMINYLEKNPENNNAALVNYDLGNYYFTNKKYNICISYLSKVDLTTLSETDKLECNFKLGYAYMNLKDFDKAGTAFQRIKSSKNKYTYAANYYLGYIYYKKELYDASELLLKKAYENQAYKQVVPPLLAQVYNKQGKYDTLVNYCEKILAYSSDFPSQELLLLAAEGYYNLKKYKQAVQFFEKYISIPAELGITAIAKYGISLYKIQLFEKSISTLKKSAEYNDTTGQVSAFYLGLNWLKLNNKQFAFNAFNQARKMKYSVETSLLASIEYGKTGLELGAYDAVITSCKEFIIQNPSYESHPELNECMSEAYLHSNDYNAVIKYVESVKSRTTNLNKVYQLATYYKAIELFNDSKFEDALDFFDRSTQNDFDKETTVMSYYYSAECFAALKDYEPAIENYAKVVKFSTKITPNAVANNYFGLAHAYFNRKEYAQSATYFKSFLEVAPKETKTELVCEGTMRLADSYYAIKKYKEASLKYNDAITKNCNYQDYCYFQMGMVLAGQQKDNEAKSAFESVWRNMPQSLYYYDALYNYGLVDFENTKYELAIVSFDIIIAQNKSTIYVPLALQKRAIAFSNIKQFDKAAADYSQILKDYPNHKIASDAVLGLQEALSHTGKNATFDTLVATYKSINPNDANIEKAELDNAKSLYFAQKYQDAILKLENYIKMYPNSLQNNDLTFLLGDAYLKTNDYANAILQFDKVIQTRKSTYFTKAVLKMAELNYDKKDYENAISYYFLLSNNASNKKEINIANNGLMLSYYESKDYDSSSYFANVITKTDIATPAQISRALLYQAKNALALDSENAQDLLIACGNASKDQFGAEATYLHAELLRNKFQFATSNEILFHLINTYSGFPKWYGKSFLMLADNYISMKELYQAKATLISIIENSKENELVNMAKDRLSKLDNTQ
ncbi:MAG: tetratricopeptide repeat protein [Bacteroidota bacterium]|nr:tetratricopeptide repeat protein [Bacteroidota bacterium]